MVRGVGGALGNLHFLVGHGVKGRMSGRLSLESE